MALQVVGSLAVKCASCSCHFNYNLLSLFYSPHSKLHDPALHRMLHKVNKVPFLVNELEANFKHSSYP